MISAVYLDDDGFNGGITLYEYTYIIISPLGLRRALGVLKDLPLIARGILTFLST